MGCTNSVPQTGSTTDEPTSYPNYNQSSYGAYGTDDPMNAVVPAPGSTAMVEPAYPPPAPAYSPPYTAEYQTSPGYPVGTQVTYPVVPAQGLPPPIATAPPASAMGSVAGAGAGAGAGSKPKTYKEVKAELVNRYHRGLCRKPHFNDRAYRIILEVFPSIYAAVEFEYRKKDIKLWTVDKEIYFEMYHIDGKKTKLRRRDYSEPTTIYRDWPVKVWSEVKLNDFPDSEDPFSLILCCYRIIKRDPIVNLATCLGSTGWTQVRNFIQCRDGNRSEMYGPLRNCLFDNKSKTVYAATGINGAYFSIDWDDPNDVEDNTDSDDEDDGFETNIDVNVIVTAEAGAAINSGASAMDTQTAKNKAFLIFHKDKSVKRKSTVYTVPKVTCQGKLLAVRKIGLDDIPFEAPALGQKKSVKFNEITIQVCELEGKSTAKKIPLGKAFPLRDAD